MVRKGRRSRRKPIPLTILKPWVNMKGPIRDLMNSSHTCITYILWFWLKENKNSFPNFLFYFILFFKKQKLKGITLTVSKYCGDKVFLRTKLKVNFLRPNLLNWYLLKMHVILTFIFNFYIVFLIGLNTLLVPQFYMILNLVPQFCFVS
jgi:hypothetical protein